MSGTRPKGVFPPTTEHATTSQTLAGAGFEPSPDVKASAGIQAIFECRLFRRGMYPGYHFRPHCRVGKHRAFHTIERCRKVCSLNGTFFECGDYPREMMPSLKNRLRIPAYVMPEKAGMGVVADVRAFRLISADRFFSEVPQDH
jgi:hypothetical protein